MTLARDLIDAALAADLSQNELRVFLALFRQTLCYGKSHDALTLKRLAALAHIRKDRLPPALAKILQLGLFSASEHKVFEHDYAINADFLTKHSQGFYTLALPKKRGATHETESISEKQTHTSTTLTALNPTTKPVTENSEPEPDALPYPTHFNAQTRQAAARILDGLSPTDARDCLLILQQSLNTQRIQSPLGYLHHLAQAARHGSLDRSQLNPYRQTELAPDIAKKLRLRQLHAEIHTLDTLFKQAQQAGVEMDKRSAAQRAAYVAEYQRLIGN